MIAPDRTAAVIRGQQLRKPKREKRIFSDSAEVAHVWAQQRQAYGCNPRRNIYFEGATIYSYGTHFPIARFAGRDVVLVNCNGWSNTTAGHKRDVADALSGLQVTKIYVDNPGESASVDDNLRLLWAEIVELATKHRDARQTDYRVQLRGRLANYGRYTQFVRKGRTKQLAALLATMGVDPQFWAPLAKCSTRAAAEIDSEKAKREATAEARSAARREREEAKRERGEQLHEKLWPIVTAAWRNGCDRAAVPAELATEFADCLSATELAQGVRVDGFIYNGWGKPTLLRIVGDEIQTSRGARVTIRAAKRAWPHLLAHQVPPQPVGQYQATAFEDGILTIGCHRIPASEINLMAAQLGLEGRVA